MLRSKATDFSSDTIQQTWKCMFLVFVLLSIARRDTEEDTNGLSILKLTAVLLPGRWRAFGNVCGEICHKRWGCYWHRVLEKGQGCSMTCIVGTSYLHRSGDTQNANSIPIEKQTFKRTCLEKCSLKTSHNL